MSIASAISSTLVRTLAAAAAFCVAGVLGLFLAVFGGGTGSGAIELITVAGLLGAGWALLPMFRESYVLALVSASSWAYLGFRLSQFGEQSVHGWMLGPWAIATLAIVVGMFLEPPKYLRAPAQNDGFQDTKPIDR